jgi:succinyl-diaminopimelate desuccinylase
MPEIDAIELARALVRRPSVTPKDEGALDIYEAALKSIGFSAERLVFSEHGQDPVDNLYARWGEGPPVFGFAGHTDVVPAGEAADWTHPPFAAVVEDGVLWGRGAADMKGALAAFAAAAQRIIARRPGGSIVVLATGDEEGPAVNGTKKLLAWMAERGERISHCLVGEPSSNEALGDMIKTGRRGSTNCWLTVFGEQGHVAYPDRARNPIPALLKKLLTLSEAPLDAGYPGFPPSSLQITDIHVGNPAANVIPAKATARFNVRFNPNWTGAALERFLRARLDEAARETGARYALKAVFSGDAFQTTDEAFLDLLSETIAQRTGRPPVRSTAGGTSDARFIKDVAPVAEFGLVGRTIHQVDERAPLADILALADLYEAILTRYFATFAAR